MMKKADEMKNEVHIGSLIKSKMEEQGRRTSWLAQKLACDRTNIYKLYSRPTVDAALLLKISQLLDYDFFQHYSQQVAETKAKK